jgi:Na+/H+ antiporter NhaD/arsenite permease-like protein
MEEIGNPYLVPVVISVVVVIISVFLYFRAKSQHNGNGTKQVRQQSGQPKMEPSREGNISMGVLVLTSGENRRCHSAA